MKYDTWKIGHSIRNLRKKHMWSVEELSRKIGVSPSHLTQIELGYRNVCMELFYKMMGVFGEDANTVLDITDKYENKYRADIIPESGGIFTHRAMNNAV